MTLLVLFIFCVTASLQAALKSDMPAIRVSNDGSRFVFAGSDTEFKPWGFNYDRDSSGRLLEDYWLTEWDAVARDFREMRALGGNVVRIHLQVGKFMKSARDQDETSLAQLARLLALAEDNGLYLDITGLGCYDRKAVPQWYNKLDEKHRWTVQARFWTAVAETCARSPAIFCYDLMNEPIVSGDGVDKDWTPGEFAGKCYVQRLTLGLAGRTDKQIAKAWIEKMTVSIRKHDARHLITIGAIPWVLVWPTAKPLFYSREVSEKLDFVSVHFYPKKGEVDKALTALSAYKIGKPLVIEETFPLDCSVDEEARFIERSRNIACGCITFYWGQTIEQYRHETNNVMSGITADWLDYFTKNPPQR